MLAYDALRDRAKVASTYQRCLRALRELKLEPSEETRALAFRRTSKLNIPLPLTSFIGREEELKEIAGLLSESRLVTLTGSGGVGKTRLAIQVVAEVLDMFPDGVWFLDLAPLSDPVLVPNTLASLLGLREPGDNKLSVTELLINYFRSRTALVIFDNCEHLIETCAQLVNSLLASCENLSILTTSREALRVSGEIPYRVPSLEVPRLNIEPAIDALAKIESVRLFIERAVAISPGIARDPQNVSVIAQICQRLDGIPLAIELAAARVGMLTVEQIVKRLDDRFTLLTRGLRTALPRHQTLHAAIDWSFGLLSEQEQVLFRRLSVFVGGFTLHAAETIAAEGAFVQSQQVIDLLGDLINKSLVRVEERSRDIEVETRYGMLETIWEYAREKLREAGEADMLRIRHLEFFLNMVEELEPKLEGDMQRVWLDQLEAEIDNLRAGLDWALANEDIDAAARFAGALPRFWRVRGVYHMEGFERLKGILDRSDAIRPSAARLKALNAYLSLLWPWGRVTEIQSRGEEALELSMQLGDRRNSAFALLWLGMGATAQGDYPLARSYLERSLEIWQGLEERTHVAWPFFFLGEVGMLQGDISRAEECYLQAARFWGEVQDHAVLAMPLRRLGQLAMSHGDLLKASAFIKESLQHNWKVQDSRGISMCLAALASLSLLQGENERAVKLLGVVDAVIELTTSLTPIDQQQYEHNVSKLRDQIDRPTFIQAWTEGRGMTLEQAVELALRG
jgi:predicted ATPase